MSRRDSHEQFPASPTLLKTLNISKEIKDMYLQRRHSILNYKKDDTIHDDRLRPYQNEDVSYLTKIKHKGVFNQQRTGKTPTTIVSLKRSNCNKNLIITTGSNLYTWQQEYTKWHGGKSIVIKSSQHGRRRTALYRNNDKDTTFIMTVGIMKNDLPQIIEYLKEFDAIVVDEASFLQNFYGMRSKKGSQQAKAVMMVGKYANQRYALTGTPAPNYAYDIFGILHFLYPDLFTSYWRFIDYYFGSTEQQINRRGDTVKKESPYFLSPQKRQEMTEFLELISIQRKRKEIMEWLIEPDIEEIFLPMESTQERIYNELSKWWEYEDVVAINSLDLMVKERMLAVDPTILGFKATSNKTEWILEYLKDHPNIPVIITSFFTSYLERLQALLTEEGYNPALMVGSTTASQRNAIKEDFQKGKLNIILGNQDVIQYGLTLDRGEALIFVDQSLTWETNDQVKDRIVATKPEILEAKNGQKIIKLISKGTVDEYLNERLKIKADSNKIVNDYLATLKKER